MIITLTEDGIPLEAFKDFLDVTQVAYYKFRKVRNKQAWKVTFFDKDKNVIKIKGDK